MRNIPTRGDWLRSHWLEALLVLGLLGILLWFGTVGAGFAPRPTPTPTPRPATATPAPALIRASATPRPTRTPTVLPTATLTATVQVTATATVTATVNVTSTVTVAGGTFDGERAFKDLLAQVAFGPRPTGTEANQQTQAYIRGQLKAAGWSTEDQNFTYMNVGATNIIAKAGHGPVIIVGAHFDTRRQADQDPDPARKKEPILGANDGASGVAVLLELARTLDVSKLNNEVWLVFFDAEDNGGLDGWDFLAGSRYVADHLTITPKGVIIVDMVGDKDQQIYKERNSTPALQDAIWQVAATLGDDKYFMPTYKWSMEDDHTPFLQKGLTATDIIDFDYPYWHTTQDTADKCSAAALEHVGRVLQVYLQGQKPS